MSVLIFMLYLLLVCVGFLVSARYHLAVIGAIFLILYVYVFRCTYQDKMRFSYLMLNITTVWIIRYIWFGTPAAVSMPCAPIFSTANKKLMMTVGSA